MKIEASTPDAVPMFWTLRAPFRAISSSISHNRGTSTNTMRACLASKSGGSTIRTPHFPRACKMQQYGVDQFCATADLDQPAPYPDFQRVPPVLMLTEAATAPRLTDVVRT